MKNFRLIIQYEGTRYAGWQRQKGKNNTIQGKIEEVLSKMAGESVEIHGAGRTDAGVHARAQVAHVHLDERFEADSILSYLNEYLPKDIRILNVKEAGARFHARLNAVGKCYEYRCLKKGCYDVFSRNFTYELTKEYDVERMKAAARFLEGKHDFAAFCSKAGKKKSTVRVIHSIEIIETEDTIIFRYKGNGFLYNMVRILTGTLLEVGEGKRTPVSMKELLENKKRENAGEKVPSIGLTMMYVLYD